MEWQFLAPRVLCRMEPFLFGMHGRDVLLSQLTFGAMRAWVLNGNITQLYACPQCGSGPRDDGEWYRDIDRNVRPHLNSKANRSVWDKTLQDMIQRHLQAVETLLIDTHVS